MGPEVCRGHVHASRVAFGFTLIEIMVAIAIFALIGIAATRMLAGVVDLEQRMDARAERLFALQRAFSILDRDLTELLWRGIRDGFGDPIAPVTSREEGGIEFTRAGWANPLGEPRSGLQRVAYAYDGERVERRYWRVLDRAEDSDPVTQVLLDNVRDFSVAFIDEDGERHDRWPPEEVMLPGDPAIAPEAPSDRPVRQRGLPPLPLGVEVSLDMPPLGTITRLWRLAATFEPGTAGEEDARRPSAEGGGTDQNERSAGSQVTQ